MIRSADPTDVTARPALYFEIRPDRPFSLERAAAQIQRLRRGAAAARPGPELLLAFAVELTWEPAAVSLVQRRGRVSLRASGGRADQVSSQVARMLSLDVGAAAVEAVTARDPVLRRLVARYPDLRPVGFPSPYEAAAWALLARALGPDRAGRALAQLTAEHGTIVPLGAAFALAFPGPHTLRALPPVTGLADGVLRDLHALGAAAWRGELDSRALRAMSADEGIAYLTQLPGIDRRAAEIVLDLGAAVPDVLPAADPRLVRAASLAYGRALDPSALEELSQRWRPHRRLAAFLLRHWLDEQDRIARAAEEAFHPEWALSGRAP